MSRYSVRVRVQRLHLCSRVLLIEQSISTTTPYALLGAHYSVRTTSYVRQLATGSTSHPLHSASTPRPWTSKRSLCSVAPRRPRHPGRPGQWLSGGVYFHCTEYLGDHVAPCSVCSSAALPVRRTRALQGAASLVMSRPFVSSTSTVIRVVPLPQHHQQRQERQEEQQQHTHSQRAAHAGTHAGTPTHTPHTHRAWSSPCRSAESTVGVPVPDLQTSRGSRSGQKATGPPQGFLSAIRWQSMLEPVCSLRQSTTHSYYLATWVHCEATMRCATSATDTRASITTTPGDMEYHVPGTRARPQMYSCASSSCMLRASEWERVTCESKSGGE